MISLLTENRLKKHAFLDTLLLQTKYYVFVGFFRPHLSLGFISLQQCIDFPISLYNINTRYLLKKTHTVCQFPRKESHLSQCHNLYFSFNSKTEIETLQMFVCLTKAVFVCSIIMFVNLVNIINRV